MSDLYSTAHKIAHKMAREHPEMPLQLCSDAANEAVMLRDFSRKIQRYSFYGWVVHRIWQAYLLDKQNKEERTMKGKKLSNETIAQLEELRRQGLSFGEISKKTGVPISTVGKRLKDFPAGGDSMIFSEEMSAEKKEALVDEINSSIAEVNKEPQSGVPEPAKTFAVPELEPINAYVPEQAEPDKPSDDVHPTDVADIARRIKIAMKEAFNLSEGARVDFMMNDNQCKLEIRRAGESAALTWRR